MIDKNHPIVGLWTLGSNPSNDQSAATWKVESSQFLRQGRNKLMLPSDRRLSEIQYSMMVAVMIQNNL